MADLDPMQAAIRSEDAKPRLGVWIQPGLGQAYPELVNIFQELFRKRVASLPWVPVSWLGQVQQLQNENPTSIVKLFPAQTGNGTASTNMPEWITSDSARTLAWQTVTNAMNKAQMDYAAADAEAGKAELDRLMANADFWNTGWGATAINVATAIKDAPGNIVGAIGDGALSVIASFVKRTWYLFAIAGVVYVVWANRDKVARKAVDKVGGLL